MPKIAVLIVAAGHSSRLPADRPKPYLRLNQKPVLRYSIDKFLLNSDINTVRVVINPDHRAYYQEAIDGGQLPPAIYGGKTRQESVFNGLKALEQDRPDWVLIHDAARPGVDSDTIERVLEGLKQYHAVIPAIAVVDTIKRVKDGQVVETPVRQELVAVQTPQGFHYSDIWQAHQKVIGQEHTDDASIAEAAGMRVHIVAGHTDNRKLTTKEDWQMMTMALEGARHQRTGMGFDVHRLIEDASRPLMICGVEIPSAFALEGHSDADVGLHAAVDAILGALAKGDIGQHFPPSDARWKNADSALFVKEARGLLESCHATLTHLDITIICEQPKISPHREAMRGRISDLLGVPIDQVSVKATTTEGLGFTGRAEGIAAQAVATIIIAEAPCR